VSTHKQLVVTIVLACLWVAAAGQAQAKPADTQPAGLPQPSANSQGDLLDPASLGFQAVDKPNDAGAAVFVTWKRQPALEGPDISYEVLMSNKAEGPFNRVFFQPADDCLLQSHFASSFGFAPGHIPTADFMPAKRCQCANCMRHALEVSRDPEAKAELQHDKPYYFQLRVYRGKQVIGTTPTVSGVPVSNWFAWQRMNLLLGSIILSSIVMMAVWIAKRNPANLFIRRIGGLDAVDEALGRATEMGKPVFFCYGGGSIGDVVGISSMNLLAKVAERVAEYGTEMKVTCQDYLVLPVSQGMVKDAYTKAGRPDGYKQDNVFYVTDGGFAYAMAVGNMLIREKAGTVFFFGGFGIESLLLTETGAVTKAIQIAGTDSFTQIPFFITTCDYTLIGEELYAASAYLSREPRLVGSVKGQDAVKTLFITLMVVGTALASAGVWWFSFFCWPLG
jgi:hypothetical protein